MDSMRSPAVQTVLKDNVMDQDDSAAIKSALEKRVLWKIDCYVLPPIILVSG